jgi:hypothetical protein
VVLPINNNSLNVVVQDDSDVNDASTVCDNDDSDSDNETT